MVLLYILLWDMGKVNRSERTRKLACIQWSILREVIRC